MIYQKISALFRIPVDKTNFEQMWKRLEVQGKINPKVVHDIVIELVKIVALLEEEYEDSEEE